ncbi:hypothetical protein NKG05_05595 [Oerskovia sp. M15]
MVTDSGELVVLAVKRLGEELTAADDGENRRRRTRATTRSPCVRRRTSSPGAVGRSRPAHGRPRRARRRHAGRHPPAGGSLGGGRSRRSWCWCSWWSRSPPT